MEETYVPKNKRQGLLKWAGWLNIISAIGSLLYGILALTSKFELIYEDFQAEMTYEEFELIASFLNGTGKTLISIALLIFGGLLLFFGIKQLGYAKIYKDEEFMQTKNLLLAILSFIFGNTISGILGLIAHNTKNNEFGANASIPTAHQSSSADEMQAKILKLKEMYANGEITLEEYTNLMDKLTF